MYKWQQVKALRAQGKSIKKIAKLTKLSKNTVRKYLRSSEPPEFKARQYKRLLDQHEDMVKEMLEKDCIGTRIYNEIYQLGYTGSLSTVHRYISGIKKTEQISKLATTRVETAAGKQFQYDWKEWDLPINGHVVKIYIHEVILSYSRKKYYVSSLSIATGDIIRAIAGAIKYFGGLAEELVIDNPKQMVITHNKNGTVRYNDEFLRFCGMYGLQPNPCRNYRARTKGKAERPFYYLQEHLLRGLEVNDMVEFDGLLAEWTDKYNARIHSSLKESPDERFQTEKDTLKPIPLVEPALLYPKEVREVSNDGYISWDGALYPVAMSYCLQKVRVEVFFGKTIKVYNLGGSLVTEHKTRLFNKGIRPAHPEHENRNEAYVKKKERHCAESIKKFIETFQEIGQTYAKGLKIAVTANIYWHIEEIMKYTMLYSISDVSSVLAECIEIGVYHKNNVRRLLEHRVPKSHSLEIWGNPYIVSSVDIRRPLSDYKVEVAV
ncbi:MAG: IS21 family transposase [Nitrospirae bacterium]|nr:IS21 family transposase [Nitrospirota bacterium]